MNLRGELLPYRTERVRIKTKTKTRIAIERRSKLAAGPASPGPLPTAFEKDEAEMKNIYSEWMIRGCKPEHMVRYSPPPPIPSRVDLAPLLRDDRKRRRRWGKIARLVRQRGSDALLPPTRYVGVVKKSESCYYAEVSLDGKSVREHGFQTAIDAAKARDGLVKKLGLLGNENMRGEAVRLNFPDSP
jgi:hypothetical protein